MSCHYGHANQRRPPDAIGGREVDRKGFGMRNHGRASINSMAHWRGGVNPALDVIFFLLYPSAVVRRNWAVIAHKRNMINGIESHQMAHYKWYMIKFV